MRPLVAVVIVALVGASCSKDRSFGTEADPAVALQRCNEILKEKSFDPATYCYENVRSRFPTSAVSSEAELKLADIYFEKKEYLAAAEAYRLFIKLHPTHYRLAYVYYRTGLSYLKESPKAIDRDQQYLEDAIGFLEVGERYFPGSDYEEETHGALLDARRRIASRHLYVGKFYYKRGEYRSALPRLAEVADKYRGPGLDEKALYLTVVCYLKLGERKKAVIAASHLKERYPSSGYLDKLMNDLGVD